MYIIYLRFYFFDIQRTVHREIILIMKANEMQYLSNLFDKVLCMFRTGPSSGVS